MSVNESVKSNIFLGSASRVFSSEIFWVLSFTMMTFLAAQVEVPVQPVPFTLQTMLVILAGAFLGRKNGAYSQIIYLFLGSIGLPVFAGFSSTASLYGPTGGYLLAFPLGAYVSGLILEKRRSIVITWLAMALASLAIILTGASYLSLLFHRSFGDAFFVGAIIFSVWDIIKISAAASIYFAISKKYSKLPL
ncbi:MAG: biotin transporter BioY [Ignavibacteria bacterium]|jgi:biotin transport system substrate-specific component|nr:biotin transporter BioY [Ignavibacteria bacterium]MCU7501684.1 biotin transporter BioY [Ignavibacteria bacterium]MCU7516909.1 biotin transporter BioY [Ignavibacteria bacterium]